MQFTAGDITVNFNAAFWKGKTEEEFIAHEKHHGLTPTQLKEAFALIPQAAKEEKKELAAAEAGAQKQEAVATGKDAAKTVSR